ncbi:carbohydrate ABC transporter permease [Petroclostridium xylanilyticum]|uniref:carbohydrate ABC transporter permease n=1 Tax=Petroclostridium xylanilyticum TaxID=1792311 RepID=UPI001FA87B23|nr:carbohydrate ABC transporter permease [Petroclostridium xylanilyticum]
MIALSFSSNHAILSMKVAIFPVDFTLETYRAVFKDNAMINSLLFTIVLTVSYTILGMIMTICAAYPLTKKNLKGRNFFLLLIVITMYFSGGLIPDYLLIKNLGLLNKIWALILPGLINAYYLIILKTFFSTLPDSLQESAYLDGCTDIGILVKIILPLSKPVLATLSLFYAVGRWNGLMDALFYITNPKLYPIQLKLYQIVYNSMQLDIQQMEGSAAAGILPESLKAASVIFATVPILIVYPWLQRYFVAGIMIGAVKG